MVTKRILSLVVSVLLSLSVSLVAARNEMPDIMQEIREQFAIMHDHFSSMFDHFAKEHEPISVVHTEEKISIKHEKDAVKVLIVLGDTTKDFKALLKDNSLAITIPDSQDKIDLQLDDNLLKISFKVQSKSSSTKDGGAKTESVYFGHSQMTEFIQEPLDFKKASITYANGILTINIPKIQKKEDDTKVIEIKVNKTDEPAGGKI